MEVEYNIWAMIAAFAVSMVGGMAWYHPKVFGEKWMKSAGLTQKQMDGGQMMGMATAVVRAATMSVGLFHLTYIVDAFYTDNSFLVNALITSLIAGVGFTWIAMIMHDAFEQRPTYGTKINVGFQVATMLLAGLAIGLIAG